MYHLELGLLQVGASIMSQNRLVGNMSTEKIGLFSFPSNLKFDTTLNSTSSYVEVLDLLGSNSAVFTHHASNAKFCRVVHLETKNCF